jgi:hypothetical protein
MHNAFTVKFGIWSSNTFHLLVEPENNTYIRWAISKNDIDEAQIKRKSSIMKFKSTSCTNVKLQTDVGHVIQLKLQSEQEQPAKAKLGPRTRKRRIDLGPSVRSALVSGKDVV